nr:unnamed protein product [Callosobruchus chinensis]
MKEDNFLIFQQFSSTLEYYPQRFFANALRLFLSDGKIGALKPNMQNVWSLSCFRQIIKSSHREDP